MATDRPRKAELSFYLHQKLSFLCRSQIFAAVATLAITAIFVSGWPQGHFQSEASLGAEMYKMLIAYLTVLAGFGIGTTVHEAMIQIASAAKNAHQRDQLSYSAFTKAMTSGKIEKSK